MKKNVSGSRSQAEDARWSTALLASFIIAIVFMFGTTHAKTDNNVAATSTTAEATPVVTARKADDNTVAAMGNMQIATTH
jgi:hypothetical protein